MANDGEDRSEGVGGDDGGAFLRRGPGDMLGLGKGAHKSRGGRRPRSKADDGQGRIRVTFDFNQATVETLDRVREKAGASTNNETVRRALALLEKHFDEVAAGARPIYLREDGTQVEIVIG
jgi:hypothetical protein